MNFLLLNYIIASWIEVIASLFFGIFILIKSTQKSHKLFALHSLCVCWWSFCTACLIASDKYSAAFFWGRIVYAGGIFIS
ncbi:MAG: histidine kinase N-terminal 7TM domain-containing protein, partial [Candidatus Omnitrophota bacterium]